MKQDISRRTISIQSYFERLFTVPRGFKKFYPESGGSVPKSGTGSKTSRANAKKSGSGGGGGKGGGNKDKDPFDTMWGYIPLIVGTGAVGIALYALDQSTQG